MSLRTSQDPSPYCHTQHPSTWEVKFKLPNEASSHAVKDAITNTTKSKQVTFSTPLHTSTPNNKKESKKQKLKSVLKPIHISQDHPQLALSRTIRCRRSPLYKTNFVPLGPFQNHSTPKIAPFQDHFTTKDV